MIIRIPNIRSLGGTGITFYFKDKTVVLDKPTAIYNYSRASHDFFQYFCRKVCLSAKNTNVVSGTIISSFGDQYYYQHNNAFNIRDECAPWEIKNLVFSGSECLHDTADKALVAFNRISNLQHMVNTSYNEFGREAIDNILYGKKISHEAYKGMAIAEYAKRLGGLL